MKCLNFSNSLRFHFPPNKMQCCFNYCMSWTCTGAHVWFWVHVGTTVMATGVFVSSIAGMWWNMNTFGRNIDAAGVAHRAIGYTSSILFLLMIILGGLRTLDKGKRLILLTLHSAFGFLIYFLNLLAMITSNWIPASPSMGSNCDSAGIPIGFGKVFFVVLAWIFLDLIMHFFLTIFQCVIDRRHGVIRPWYCPIIPILPYNSADDFVGSFIRKLTMLAYGGTAFVMANTAVGLILTFDDESKCAHLLGTLDCDDPWGCSATSQAYHRYTMNFEKSMGHYVIFEGAEGF